MVVITKPIQLCAWPPADQLSAESLSRCIATAHVLAWQYIAGSAGTCTAILYSYSGDDRRAFCQGLFKWW